MTENLIAGIVRILDSDGSTAGTGFVVTDEGLIVTCAHVVQDAGAGPGDTVRVDFYAADGQWEAKVEPAWWRDSNAEDIAILRPNARLPTGVLALPFGPSAPSKGHRFETFGFPEVNPEEGLAGVGEILASVTHQGIPILQLASQEVTSGFSGAPVWDVQNRCVVGMVTAITLPDKYHRLTTAVFAVSSDLVVRICPRLAPGAWSFDSRQTPIIVEPIVKPPLQVGETIHLHGKPYLVREIVAQRAFDAFLVRAVRASDVQMTRNVGIIQVDTISKVPETQAHLARIMNYSRLLGQAAENCAHLPQVYDLVEDKPHAIWRIVEWIDGPTAEQFVSAKSLPDASTLSQLLGWTADVCDALGALNSKRLSHSGVCEQMMCVAPGKRGAVLIDPGFAISLGAITAVPAPFDPAKDIRDLAATLYRLATHQPPQTAAASQYNPIIPTEMDEALHDALSGSIRKPESLKRNLLDARRAIW